MTRLNKYEVELQDGGTLCLFSEDCADKLLLVAFDARNRSVTVNDCISNTFGDELVFHFDGYNEAIIISLLFDSVLELRVGAYRMLFSRFDDSYLQRVAFAQLYKGRDSNGSMKRAERAQPDVMFDFDKAHRTLDSREALAAHADRLGLRSASQLKTPPAIEEGDTPSD